MPLYDLTNVAGRTLFWSFDYNVALLFFSFRFHLSVKERYGRPVLMDIS